MRDTGPSHVSAHSSLECELFPHTGCHVITRWLPLFSTESVFPPGRRAKSGFQQCVPRSPISNVHLYFIGQNCVWPLLAVRKAGKCSFLAAHTAAPTSSVSCVDGKEEVKWGYCVAVSTQDSYLVLTTITFYIISDSLLSFWSYVPSVACSSLCSVSAHGN